MFVRSHEISEYEELLKKSRRFTWLAVPIELEIIELVITVPQQKTLLVEERSESEQYILCRFLPKPFDDVTINQGCLVPTLGSNDLSLEEKETNVTRNEARHG